MNPQETPKPDNNPVNPTVSPSDSTQLSTQNDAPQVIVGGQAEPEIGAQTFVEKSSNASNNIYSQPQLGGLTSSETNSGKLRSKVLYKKALLIGIIFLILLVIAVGLFVMLHKTNNKKEATSPTKSNTVSSKATPATTNTDVGQFKTVTYSNGAGSNFQLSFYSNYSLENGAGKQINLVSNVSKNGLYPLILTIFDEPASSVAVQALNSGVNAASYCNNGGDSSITAHSLNIKNTPTGYTVNMCAKVDNGISVVTPYEGYLEANNNYYYIYIIQAENGKPTLATDPQKLNIQAYDNDITTIVSSIKVIP